MVGTSDILGGHGATKPSSGDAWLRAGCCEVAVQPRNLRFIEVRPDP